MAQRKITEEEKRRKELVKEFLSLNPLKTGEDLNKLMKEMIAEMVGGALEGELDNELGYDRYNQESKETTNSRNGYSKKTLQTSYGEAELKVQKDCNGEYDPQIIRKYQKTVNQEVENKIISMYARGMTTSDMEAHIQELYGLEISDTTISRIADKVLPIAKEWQLRLLEEIYAVVFMDAIHYHVRQDGRTIKKTVYIAIGLNLNGERDVLDLWIGENESAKYQLRILNEIKSSGVEDILITCVGGLTGFNDAIAVVYPQT